MRHITITQMAHHLIDINVTEESICADLTAGNGNDTLYLAKKAKHVYAFDIQAQAIENTKEKVKDYTNVTCILDSHVHVKNYIHQPVDFAIFNFGYLPKGDKNITTMKETSLQAVQNVLDILHPQGLLCLCFYPGHEEGAKEKDYVLDYLLKQEQLLLSHYHTLQPYAPELYLLSKRKEKQL